MQMNGTGKTTVYPDGQVVRDSYNAEQAAAVAGLKTAQIYNYTRAGLLKSVVPGEIPMRFSHEELARFIGWRTKRVSGTRVSPRTLKRAKNKKKGAAHPRTIAAGMANLAKHNRKRARLRAWKLAARKAVLYGAPLVAAGAAAAVYFFS